MRRVARFLLHDFLQSGFTFVSSSATAGTYSPSTGVWSVGSLDAGASATLEIWATARPTGTYFNQAEVSFADQTDVDSIPGNCSDVGPDAEDDCALVPEFTVKDDVTLVIEKDFSTPGNDGAGDTPEETVTAGGASSSNQAKLIFMAFLEL